MKTFAVWETEYPEEGSTLIEAMTAKGAMRRYRKITGERVAGYDLTPLEASPMSAEMLDQRRLLGGAE